MMRWIVERAAWAVENWPVTAAMAAAVLWIVLINLRLDRLERRAGPRDPLRGIGRRPRG